jgi:hypothetical protein
MRRTVSSVQPTTDGSSAWAFSRELTHHCKVRHARNRFQETQKRFFLPTRSSTFRFGHFPWCKPVTPLSEVMPITQGGYLILLLLVVCQTATSKCCQFTAVGTSSILTMREFKCRRWLNPTQKMQQESGVWKDICYTSWPTSRFLNLVAVKILEISILNIIQEFEPYLHTHYFRNLKWYYYTVRSMIDRNATITSWLPAGTAWFTRKRCEIFPHTSQVLL